MRWIKVLLGIEVMVHCLLLSGSFAAAESNSLAAWISEAENTNSELNSLRIQLGSISVWDNRSVFAVWPNAVPVLDRPRIVAQLSEKSSDLQRQVVDLYFDLLLESRRRESLIRWQSLASQLENAAKAHLETDGDAQEDVLVAQLKKYEWKVESIVVLQSISAMQSQARKLLGRAPTANVEIPAIVYGTHFKRTLDEALAFAQTHLSLFRLPQGAINPEWTPPTARLFSDISDQRAAQDLARYTLVALVQDNLTTIQLVDELLRIYENEILPKNEQVIHVLLAGYAKGDTPITSVLDRMNDLMNSEIAYWNQWTKREKSVQTLLAVIGKAPGSTD